MHERLVQDRSCLPYTIRLLHSPLERHICGCTVEEYATSQLIRWTLPVTQQCVMVIRAILDLFTGQDAKTFAMPPTE